MLRAFMLACSLAAMQVDASERPPVNSSAQGSAPAEAPDDAPDPLENTRSQAWIAYCTAISEGLQQSIAPRDWALAALVVEFHIETGGHDCGSDNNTLLRRATQAAPDDVAVQWIAAHASGVEASLARTATQRLKVIDPQNTLVWFGDLADAESRGDADAVDLALKRIGASSHFAEILGAIIALFERYPVPDAYWSIATDEEKRDGVEGIAFSSALNAAVHVSVFSFQHLVASCRVDQQTGHNITHASDCAAIARLMVQQADAVLANRIGYALLRVSRTYTDDDERAARRDDWVYSHAQNLMHSDKGDTSGREMLAYENDWLATHSELEAMRRKLLRMGLSAEPPPEWVDEDSPFSAKRLQAEDGRAENERSAR